MSTESIPVPLSLKYENFNSNRDLRIDFMRGVVIFIMIVIHIDIFSLYSLLVQERIGVISGGEGFVILSGLVLGVVHRRKISVNGWSNSSKALFDRSFQLYRISIVLIASTLMLHLIPFIDASVITHFHDHYNNKSYPLYPASSAPLQHWISQILMLRSGPHQTQVLGLYVVLIFLSPFFLWMLTQKRVLLLIAFSWIIYFYNWDAQIRPTKAQFEYAFPILTWQVIFIHGMIAGYYKEEIITWYLPRKRIVLTLCSLLFLGFAVFAWNNPNANLPSWYKLDWIPAGKFYEIYGKYFSKNTLGILRIVNYTVALVVIFNILTHFWKPINKCFGWFFVPIGQASLYAFILHLYACMIIANIPIYIGLKPAFDSGNIWLNTIGHTIVLFIIWFFAVKKVAFSWIPR